MKCTEARDALLVAEPDEFGDAMLVLGSDEGDGRTRTELSAHLRGCDECRHVAMQLARDLALVGVAVARRTADTRRGQRRRLVTAITVLPIAAALVVAVRMVQRSNEKTLNAVAAGGTASGVVTVDVSPNQQATVIRTRDPKVTVVWLEQRGGM